MKKFGKLMALGLASVMLVSLATGSSEASGVDATSLQALYDEENLAYENYKKAAEQFDNARPFSNIMRAEDRHKELLEYLADKLDQKLVDNDIKVADFADYKDAIDKAIVIEKEDIETIEKMLEDKSMTEESKSILEKLLRGSQNHLKALERVVENNYEVPTAARDGKGQGKGRGNGQGRGMGFGRRGNSEECPMFEDGASRGNGPARGNGMGSQGKGNAFGLEKGQGKGNAFGRGNGMGPFGPCMDTETEDK